MPTVFQPPKVVLRDETGQAYPSAQLYFYLAGTSTAADVYQDVDLATPHAVPVVADSDGIFEPIYLDNNVSYDVSLYDQNNTLIYGPETLALGPTSVGYTTSALAADHTVTTAELGYTIAISGSHTVTLPAVADVGDGWFVLVRNVGTGIVTIDGDGSETINSYTTIGLGRESSALLICNGTSWYASISGYEMGSFTATQTGYAASLTPTVYWMKHGTTVTVFFPSASTGTSNASSMTIQLPSNLAPANTSVTQVMVTDNGTQANGLVSISTGALASFGKDASGTGGFTTSGTKGFAAGCQFRYSLG